MWDRRSLTPPCAARGEAGPGPWESGSAGPHLLWDGASISLISASDAGGGGGFIAANSVDDGADAKAA